MAAPMRSVARFAHLRYVFSQMIRCHALLSTSSVLSNDVLKYKMLRKVIAKDKRNRDRIGTVPLYPQMPIKIKPHESKPARSGRRVSEGMKKRANYLSFILYESIAQIVGAGELGVYVEISKVEVLPDLSHLNIYWEGTGNIQTDEHTQATLDSKTGLLRHSLQTSHAMGMVPKIVFVKDLSACRVKEVEYLLAQADMGEAETDLSDNNDEVENNLRDNMREAVVNLSDNNEEAGKNLSDSMRETVANLSDNNEEARKNLSNSMRETETYLIKNIGEAENIGVTESIDSINRRFKVAQNNADFDEGESVNDNKNWNGDQRKATESLNTNTDVKIFARETCGYVKEQFDYEKSNSNNSNLDRQAIEKNAICSKNNKSHDLGFRKTDGLASSVKSVNILKEKVEKSRKQDDDNLKEEGSSLFRHDIYGLHHDYLMAKVVQTKLLKNGYSSTNQNKLDAPDRNVSVKELSKLFRKTEKQLKTKRPKLDIVDLSMNERGDIQETNDFDVVYVTDDDEPNKYNK